MKQNILKLMRENNEAGLLANIHQQTDVKFVDEAAGAIGEIRAILEESKLIKNSEDLMLNNPTSSKLILKLEEILTDRFISGSKAKLKILADLSKNAFAYPITPNTTRSIITGKFDTSTEEDINAVLTELEQYGTNGEVKKDTMDLYTVNGAKNLLNNIAKNSKLIENTLKSDAVEFDLKNAVIKGLPDDFNFVLGIDMYYFMKDSSLNDREILSILIHEIGHCYTILMDVYRKDRYKCNSKRSDV